MLRRAALALAAVFALALPALAVTPDEMLKDPALETRARALSAGLRCLVCQNQSIDDSDAPLAHDIRVLLRERLEAGDSDRAVVDFLVARYGDFILLQPRFGLNTALLWATPVVVLVFGAIAIAVILRRRHPRAEAGLTDAEAARIAEITGGSEPPGGHQR